ncbi:hypothetical protein AB5I41_13260 [Sphingomonas sp. MMS24-JH45]
MFSAGVSAIALCAAVAGLAAPALAQETASPDTSVQPVEPGAGVGDDDLVVTGIRASLEKSLAIKRDGQGVVDAISAEDIGKFPDTNLANLSSASPACRSTARTARASS